MKTPSQPRKRITPFKPVKRITPTGHPQLWSCYYDAKGTVHERLSRDQIASALASGEGTLWVDIDTRIPEQVELLKGLFNFHPLAREDALNPESRVKLEEYDRYLLL